MKLVFITRKVDRGDPLTGFIFTWLNQLASQLDSLYVICQEIGDTSGLAANIEVYSFGKEKGYGKLRQSLKLLAYSFQLGKKADGFFVHMHPIYAIVVWIAAKLRGKKIVLWYTHKSVDTKLRIAHALVDRVFTASKESFRLPSKKVKIVGHGIDLEKFRFDLSPTLSPRQGRGVRGEGKFRILSIGRISPVKDYETLIKAVEILVNHREVKNIEVKIYGKIGLAAHQKYLDSLVEFVRNAELEDYVKFEGELGYDFVDEVYREADLFVNLSQTGSIDKAVLEAAASGTPVITCNEAFQQSLAKISPNFIFEMDNAEDLAEKILYFKDSSSQVRASLGQKLRAWVESEHNLDNLVKRIVAEFKL